MDSNLSTLEDQWCPKHEHVSMRKWATEWLSLKGRKRNEMPIINNRNGMSSYYAQRFRWGTSNRIVSSLLILALLCSASRISIRFVFIQPKSDAKPYFACGKMPSKWKWLIESHRSTDRNTQGAIQKPRSHNNTFSSCVCARVCVCVRVFFLFFRHLIMGICDEEQTKGSSFHFSLLSNVEMEATNEFRLTHTDDDTVVK